MEKEKLNKAVLRSIDILDYLSHSKKPVTLSAISKDLGIPKSSVFDIIHTLVHKEMVQMDEDTKCFSLDVHCFEIGSTYLSRTDIQYRFGESDSGNPSNRKNRPDYRRRKADRENQ